MTEKRIHFIEPSKHSPTIRCRLFGHKWSRGTIKTDAEKQEDNVCMRCYALQSEEWENVVRWTNHE